MRVAAGRIPHVPDGSRAEFGHRARIGRNILMGSTDRRAAGVILACSFLICFAALLVRSSSAPMQEKAASAKKSGPSSGIADAYRFNALGVAYMTQHRPADPQKTSQQALNAQPTFP